MTAIDVEVQVGTAPQVDVDVQVEPPTFTVISVLPTGPRGAVGPAGATGAAGAAGEGVPVGGTTAQVLAKATDTDFDTEWVDQTGGGGGGTVESVVAGSNVDVDATDPANPIVSMETLIDADIPASIARDSEVTAAVGAEATARDAAIEVHRADTTNVHGITDTTTIVLTDDARLSDDRDPTAHATTHQDGGTDELTLDGSQITSGTVADARIASTIARDSEVTSAIATSEAGQVRDGDAAGGVLSGTYPNPGFAADMATQAELDAEAALARNASNLTSGTVADARIPSTIARDSEIQPLIDTAINALLDGAPAALDTLNELAAAIGDDASFAASVTTALAGKQPLDADLTAIAALATTSIGRSLLAAADDAALRTILGLGTAATSAASAFQSADADLTALAAAGNSGVLSATTASFLTADETKLDGIEALADVTDAANVAAAGAQMVYVHAAGSYAIAGGRLFIGPEDPVADGFTLDDGDEWVNPT